MALIQRLLLFAIFTSYHHQTLFSCNEVERDSLLSFISPTPLNWSSSTNCCHWHGVACTVHARVSGLRLQDKHLSATINPSSLANLPFLVHINLSRNHFSGPLHQSLPPSLKELDLSSNDFNGSINPLFLGNAFNLTTFNASNNNFVGPLPSSICRTSPFLEVLDFSMNNFSGSIDHVFAHCQDLRILRGGLNSLSGSLPENLYGLASLREISLFKNRFSGPISNSIVKLPNLSVLELNDNDFVGELPRNIGLLSKLERLQLDVNSFNGTIPPSLMDCSNLTVLILRDNKFGGEISTLNFSKLEKLQVVDLGMNLLYGKVAESLCSCKNLIALRLANNNFVGEIPACMASLTSLTYLSLSGNRLSNVVGALNIFKNCQNLSIFFMANSFNDTMEIDDEGLMQSTGFQNLEYLTLRGSRIKGLIPPWIARLTKLKILVLANNKISGPIPTWLTSMPNLCLLDLAKNNLSGSIPHHIGKMQGLIADYAISDFNSLALPIFINSREYNRLFNVKRGLKLHANKLSGVIPEEISKLKSLQELDLSDNNFSGGIPERLSLLTNLEIMNVSMNNLSGEIPKSLTKLHFMSSFSVAYNDLEGEVPRGGQFDTFPWESFEGNPKLKLKRRCNVVVCVPTEGGDGGEEEDGEEEEEEEHDWVKWYNLPLGLGFSVGIVSFAIVSLLKSW